MIYSFIDSNFHQNLKNKVLNFKKNYIALLGKDVKYAPLNSIDIELIQYLFKKRLMEYGRMKLNNVHIVNGLNHSKTDGYSSTSIESIISFNKNSMIVEE